MTNTTEWLILTSYKAVNHQRESFPQRLEGEYFNISVSLCHHVNHISHGSPPSPNVTETCVLLLPHSRLPLFSCRVLPDVAVEPPRWSAATATASSPPQKGVCVLYEHYALLWKDHTLDIFLITCQMHPKWYAGVWSSFHNAGFLFIDLYSSFGVGVRGQLCVCPSQELYRQRHLQHG